jgi:AcrR family transcriptional regulator
MEEDGIEAATVSDIVARAGSSVGSFYARFPGKDDLIRYLQERVWTEARERWDEAMALEAWEGRSMEEVVEGVVGLLVRSLRTDYHRRKVLGRVRSADPEMAGLVLDFHDSLITSVTTLLLERRHAITHPDPAMAVSFGYRAVVGTIREFLEMEEAWSLAFGEGQAQSRQPDLARELARLWIGYLSPQSSSLIDAGDGAVDFFDPWG